jgi:hypothetical protein
MHAWTPELWGPLALGPPPPNYAVVVPGESWGHKAVFSAITNCALLGASAAERSCLLEAFMLNCRKDGIVTGAWGWCLGLGAWGLGLGTWGLGDGCTACTACVTSLHAGWFTARLPPWFTAAYRYCGAHSHGEGAVLR